MNPQPARSSDASGAWLARYSELKASLYLKLARRLGLHGPAGRTSSTTLPIAATSAWRKEQAGERIRNLPAFLSQAIIKQRNFQLRTKAAARPPR